MQFNRGLVMHFIVQTNFTGGVYNSGWIDYRSPTKPFNLKLNIKWFSPEVEQTPQHFPSLITDNKEKVSNFCMKL